MVFENRTEFSFGVCLYSGMLGTSADFLVTLRLLNSTSEVSLTFSPDDGIIQHNITLRNMQDDLWMRRSVFRAQLTLPHINSNPNAILNLSTAAIVFINDDGKHVICTQFLSNVTFPCSYVQYYPYRLREPSIEYLRAMEQSECA